MRALIGYLGLSSPLGWGVLGARLLLAGRPRLRYAGVRAGGPEELGAEDRPERPHRVGIAVGRSVCGTAERVDQPFAGRP
jgi:hypothetical protein